MPFRVSPPPRGPNREERHLGGKSGDALEIEEHLTLTRVRFEMFISLVRGRTI